MTYTKSAPCPVCGGWDNLPRGKGVRCQGYRRNDGKGVVCYRQESSHPTDDGGWWHPLPSEAEKTRTIPSAKEVPPLPPPQPYKDDPLNDMVVFREKTPRGYRLAEKDVYPARNAAGQVVAVQTTYRKDKNTKECKPWTWDPGTGWAIGLRGTSPIFGADALATRPNAPVLVVEGPKALRAAQVRFGGVVVVSPFNGKQSISDAFLEALKGRDKVTWWPDADKDGGSQKAFLAAAEKTDARDVRVVALPADLPDGWDLADPIPEGIDPEALLAAAVPVGGGDRPAPRWQMSSLSEIESMPPVPWLIESVFRERGFILLYGESGAGKSWTALDMACCIATGSRWGGFNTTQGKVLYVTLEDGKQGMAPRARAWITDREIKVSDANLKLIDETVPLDNDDEVITFVASVKAAAFDPDLVIFDTLALSTAGIDENAAKDAGAVVGNCKRIQRELNTAVMLIHHAKKDDARTYRGSTSWMAAVDTMISVVKSGDDAMTVECQKARSSAKFATTRWKLEPVPGVYWGDTPMVTTRYEKTEAPEELAVKKKKLTDTQENLRRVIERLTIQKHGGTETEIITESGRPRSTVRDAIERLQRYGWIFYDAERGLYHTPRNHDTVTEIDGKKSRQTPSASYRKTEMTEMTEIDGKKSRQPKPSHRLKNGASFNSLTESDGKSSPLTENPDGIPPLGGPSIPSVRHFECGDLLIREQDLL